MKTTKSQPGAKARRRIFMVDDHPITRYGLTQLMNREADLMMCGDAETAPQAPTASVSPIA